MPLMSASRRRELESRRTVSTPRASGRAYPEDILTQAAKELRQICRRKMKTAPNVIDKPRTIAPTARPQDGAATSQGAGVAPQVHATRWTTSQEGTRNARNADRSRSHPRRRLPQTPLGWPSWAVTRLDERRCLSKVGSSI